MFASSAAAGRPRGRGQGPGVVGHEKAPRRLFASVPSDTGDPDRSCGWTRGALARSGGPHSPCAGAGDDAWVQNWSSLREQPFQMRLEVDDLPTHCPPSALLFSPSPPTHPSLSAGGPVLGAASPTGALDLETDAQRCEHLVLPEDMLGCSKTAHFTGWGRGAEGLQAQRAW